jgi:tetratricopeptide (TPR) repeat protein
VSLWQRLRSALGRDRGEAPGAGAGQGQCPGPGPGPGPDGEEDRAPLPSRPGSQSGPGSESGLQRIERLIEVGRTGEAIELLSRLQARRPEDAALVLRLAEVLCERREFARAAPLLQKEVEAAGDAAPARTRVLLAEALLQIGAAEEALAQVEEVLAQDIESPRARALYDQINRQITRQSAGPSVAPPALPPPLGVTEAQALPTLQGAGGVRHQRYVLVRELGRGSAGTVYLARDTELERDLAIKIFHPRARAHEDAAARAWNEARLTAAVRHRGVVALYDLDDERAVMVMELCRGGSLRQRLQGGRLPAAAALRRAEELLDTLVAVHRTSVVHGDLKPGNLLFRGGAPGPGEDEDEEAAYGDLVIADFGVARLLAPKDGDGEAGGGPPPSSGAGTLGYIAPERRRGRALGPDADIYAAGAILGEMLLGALPLSRLGLLRGERLRIALSGAAAAELGPSLPAIQALLDAMLAEDPAARPDAAAALAALRAAKQAPKMD